MAGSGVVKFHRSELMSRNLLHPLQQMSCLTHSMSSHRLRSVNCQLIRHRHPRALFFDTASAQTCKIHAGKGGGGGRRITNDAPISDNCISLQRKNRFKLKQSRLTMFFFPTHTTKFSLSTLCQALSKAIINPVKRIIPDKKMQPTSHQTKNRPSNCTEA